MQYAGYCHPSKNNILDPSTPAINNGCGVHNHFALYIENCIGKGCFPKALESEHLKINTLIVYSLLRCSYDTIHHKEIV